MNSIAVIFSGIYLALAYMAHRRKDDNWARHNLILANMWIACSLLINGG